MNTILQRYQWVVDHPLEVLGLLAILLAVAYVIGAIVFAVWMHHEEVKAEQQRNDFDRIMRASTPPPRAAGFGSKRIG